MEKLYRYTTKGEGTFVAGRRLLTDELRAEIKECGFYLKTPKLKEGRYRFWMKEKTMDLYEHTLLPIHKKYLLNIKKEVTTRNKLSTIIFEDEYQVVESFD